MQKIQGLHVYSQEPEIDQANFGEWPHVCAIIKEVNIAQEETLGDSLDGLNGKVNVYLCGASLIAPQVRKINSVGL